MKKVTKIVILLGLLIVNTAIFAEGASGGGGSGASGGGSSSSSSSSSSSGGSSGGGASSGSSSSSSSGGSSGGSSSSSSSSGSSSSSNSDGSCPSTIGYTGYPGSGRNTATGEGYADAYKAPEPPEPPLESHGSSGSGSLSEMERLAKEAESAVSLTRAEIATLENSLANLNGKIADAVVANDEASVESLTAAANKLASEIATKRSELETNLSVYETRKTNFYNALVAGDPVQISNGNYLVSYVDFKAKDNITCFEVNRRYSTARAAESFGTGWICPFDTRIIRNRPSDAPDCMDDVEKAIEYCQKGMDSASQYISKYGEKFPSDDVNQAFERLQAEKAKYERFKELLISIQQENDKIDELNRFVTYGIYSDKSQFPGSKEQVIFVNENGDSILFHHSGNGIWIPYEITAAQKIKMFGLNADGSRSSSIDSEGGYQIVFASGAQAYYSKYGLLTKKIDSNGNITIYDCARKNDGQIRLPTGEILKVKRNANNLIERIEGDVSGLTQYSYSGTSLISVTDNSGVNVRFLYDQKNNLKSIQKADGKAVKMQYEFNPYFNKDMCTCVTDEDGNSEFFTYYTEPREVIHKNVDGGTEIFRCNSDGITVYQKGADGREIYFTPDSRGLIEKVKENGLTRRYSYDSVYRLTGISYDNGYSETFSYNALGKPLKSTDCDGFSNLWEYDSKGNIIATYFNEAKISSCSYYSNGLLKTLTENSQKKEFTYNQYGFITTKTLTADGKKFVERWEYDSKCRPVKYISSTGIETKISYPDLFSRIEVIGRLKKIERHFNERLFEVETFETDLKSGISYKKQVEYDGRGNPVRIWIDDVLISSYEYMPSKKLKAYTVWNHAEPSASGGLETARQGVRTEYGYDSLGRIITEKRKIVNEGKDGRKAVSGGEVVVRSCSYSKNGEIQTVKVSENGKTLQYVYNKKGQLIKLVFPDGYYKSYSYMPSGKLSTISDSNLNLYKRTYFRDGSFSQSHQNKLQNAQKMDFNQNGLLKSVKDFMGNETVYKYNTFGNLISEVCGFGSKSYSYDSLQRLTGFCLFDSNGNMCLEEERSFDDNMNLATTMLGGKIQSEIYYDCWSRPVKIISASGQRLLEYDCLGNCIRQEDGTRELIFEYSPFGAASNVVINSSGGVKSECYRLERDFNSFGGCVRENQSGIDVFLCNYDSSGRTKEIINRLGNKTTYDYNLDGSLKSFSTYAGGLTSFNKVQGGGNGSSFSVVNAEQKEHFYELNCFGMPVSEVSPLNLKRLYEYDKNGRLTAQTGFSGKRQFIDRSYSDGVCTIRFASGEKYVVQKNPLGLITKLSSDYSDVEYDYDRGGRLIKLLDLKNDIEVLYAYDNFGRCVSKKSSGFDFTYSYNESGIMNEISEAGSAFWVRFGYDTLNREVLRSSSNGVQIKTGYNEKGQKSFVETRDSLGNLIAADYIVYDDKNRVSLLADKNLFVKRFSYDAQGRLISTSYPYSDEICAFGIKEAKDCGLYLKTEHPDGKNVYFESQERGLLGEVLRLAGNFQQPSGVQYSWIESYEYTKLGAVKSVENPLGKINYDYDSLGRLSKKYGSNSESEGMTFVWNADNCLERILGRYTETEISYGAMERPVEIFTRNKNDEGFSIREFKYDGLGRRIYEKTPSGTEAMLLYDGISNDVLLKAPLRQNGLSQYSGLYSSVNISSSEAVRTGNFTDYSPSSGIRGGYRDSTSGETVEYEENDTASCVFLNLYGRPSVFFYSDNSIEVIAEDFFGNAGAVFSQISDCTSLMEYDTWGNSLITCKNEGFGEAKGKYRSSLLFYNLSARDYCPELKSFTTMDIAKDGSNWFAYCVCDPVNYRDSTGLKKRSATDKENLDYAYSLMRLAANFSLLDYNSEGDSYFIPGRFDCADVAMAMDTLAAMAAGIEGYSDKATAFSNAFKEGKLKDAAESVCSKDFFGDFTNSFTKTSDGYERNTLASYNSYFAENGEYNDTAAYISEMRNRADALSSLRNPNIVQPGTVLAWKNPDNPTADPEKGWVGHTMIVTSRTFDEMGLVTGFTYMEGHTKGNQTKVGYMNVSPDSCVPDYDGNVYSIDSWKGTFLGTYEVEAGNAVSAGGCGK